MPNPTNFYVIGTCSRTNLPKEVMGFLEYPFPPNKYSYIGLDEVQDYLEAFAEKYQLNDDINFHTCVRNVTPLNKNSKTTWLVQTKDLQTNIKEHEFNAILVCNAKYTKPNMPDIENLENFEGNVSHSRDYRQPDAFVGKNVVVLGSGPSAIDIALELAKVASKVTLSCRSCAFVMPPNILVNPLVVKAKRNSFITTSGEEIHCDAILFCSGYAYKFPFLSSSCGLTVEKGKYVFSLYRHLINAKYPIMALIGIPFAVCPFPQFDIQVRYFLKILKGESHLPSGEAMICEIQDAQIAKLASGTPFNHSHKLGPKQWEYNKLLAADADCTNLIKPSVEAAYARAGQRRMNFPSNYKDDFLRIINDTEFEYIEDYCPNLS